MDTRIHRAIISPLRRHWKRWVWAVIVWVVYLTRDNLGSAFLSWLGDIFGGRVKDILLLLPKDLSGLALFILAISIILVLLYDIWDTRKNKIIAVSNEKGELSNKPSGPISASPIIYLNRVHSCSNCGFGYLVNDADVVKSVPKYFNFKITCPKCGNIEDYIR